MKSNPGRQATRRPLARPVSACLSERPTPDTLLGVIAKTGLGRTDVLASLGRTDVLASLGRTDVLASLGKTDVLASLGRTDVLASLGGCLWQTSLVVTAGSARHVLARLGK